MEGTIITPILEKKLTFRKRFSNFPKVIWHLRKEGRKEGGQVGGMKEGRGGGRKEGVSGW